MLQKQFDGTKIKCRGYTIAVFDVRNSDTLTKAYIGSSTVYLSQYEPIAIKYKDGNSIMTFANFGAKATKDKITLRKSLNVTTVMTQDFNAALFELLSRR